MAIDRVERDLHWPPVVATIAHSPGTAAAELRPWIQRFVRIGYAAKGTIYLLIGTLALRLALGAGGRLTDSKGVLKTLEHLPAGMALLSVIAVGLLAYAGWEIAEAIWDTNRKGSDLSGWLSRGLTAIKGGVYGAIGFEAFQLVVGNGGSAHDADDYARSALQFPFGGVVLGLVGLGIALYGVKQIWMAWTSRFDSDLDTAAMRREGAGWVLTLGRAGIGARGVTLAIMGVAVARAGFGERASDASGTREALWAVFTQPNGTWLLAAVAAGLMCYGVFQLLHARYARLR